MSQHAGPMALTQLAEDEQMFRDTVRRFAVEQVRPLVYSMDDSQQMDPGLINKSPYEQGWIFALEMSDLKELDGLMSEEQYGAFLKSGDHGSERHTSGLRS